MGMNSMWEASGKGSIGFEGKKESESSDFGYQGIDSFALEGV
jgi:hypothetical protein